MKIVIQYATRYVKLRYNEALTNGDATINDLRDELKEMLTKKANHSRHLQRSKWMVR